MKATRENVGQMSIIEAHSNKCLLLELPTGFGKTKIAMDIINSFEREPGRERTVLLLVAKTVHKRTWMDEIGKWGGMGDTVITMECYESLRKHRDGEFDFLIMDECHHIASEKRMELLASLNIRTLVLGLSATIPRELKDAFRRKAPGYGARVISLSLQDAISSDVLPEPEVHAIRLSLDGTKETECIELNMDKARKGIIECSFKEMRSHMGAKKGVRAKCTQQQKSQWLDGEVERLKMLYNRNKNLWNRNAWMKACIERLRWLACLKNDRVLRILNILEGERSLTFCCSIDQSETLGSNCINSKNKRSRQVLEDFNEGRINRITTCNILNEGVNLVNCRFGIFANINASKTMQRQRVGRVLRHARPVIVIPYWVDTREEEIVEEMLKEYKRKYVHFHEEADMEDAMRAAIADRDREGSPGEDGRQGKPDHAKG